MSEMRDNCRVQAMIDVSTYIDDQKLDTCIRNLSCTGIMIADHPDSCLAEDGECKIDIPVGDGKTLKLDAKVVWKKDGMVGLTFANIDDSIKGNLQQLILRQVS